MNTDGGTAKGNKVAGTVGKRRRTPFLRRVIARLAKPAVAISLFAFLAFAAPAQAALVGQWIN